MPSMTKLSQMIRVDSKQLSKRENLIIEAALFSFLCAEMDKIIKDVFSKLFKVNQK